MIAGDIGGPSEDLQAGEAGHELIQQINISGLGCHGIPFGDLQPSGKEFGHHQRQNAQHDNDQGHHGLNGGGCRQRENQEKQLADHIQQGPDIVRFHLVHLVIDHGEVIAVSLALFLLNAAFQDPPQQRIAEQRGDLRAHIEFAAAEGEFQRRLHDHIPQRPDNDGPQPPGDALQRRFGNILQQECLGHVDPRPGQGSKQEKNDLPPAFFQKYFQFFVLQIKLIGQHRKITVPFQIESPLSI